MGNVDDVEDTIYLVHRLTDERRLSERSKLSLGRSQFLDGFEEASRSLTETMALLKAKVTPLPHYFSEKKPPTRLDLNQLYDCVSH